MRIYLAGPMRGYKNDNIPAFNAAAHHLRSLGFEVFNPAEGLCMPGVPSSAYYMEHDLPLVCKADAVVVLSGWENSNGCRIELMVARELGKKIMAYPSMKLV